VPIAETGDPQHHIGVVEHVRAGSAASAAPPANGPQVPRATRIGLHFDRAQLEKSNMGTLAEFLQSVPGMSVATSRSASIQSTRSASTVAAGARGVVSECHLGWFVDGQRWDIPGRSDPSVDEVGSTQLSGIEALEVFRGLSEMPTEFASPDLRCGAVAIWTRRS
jgi:hypothetical protein